MTGKFSLWGVTMMNAKEYQKEAQTISTNDNYKEKGRRKERNSGQLINDKCNT